MMKVCLLFLVLMGAVFEAEAAKIRSKLDAHAKCSSRPNALFSMGEARARQIRTQNFPIMWKVDPERKVDRVEVRLEDQQVLVFQDDRVVGKSPISSGREDFPTPSGNFMILAKSKDHKSNLYGSFVNAQGKVVNSNAMAGQTPPPGCTYMPSPMPYFLRFTGDGVGLHSGFLPGYPASHGCIRIPRKFAENLFSVVTLGTPVAVLAD
jgi:lipoprotein-anchoring transpeptidase ErfK/SrfK